MIRIYCDGGSLKNGEEDSPAAAACLFLKEEAGSVAHWRVRAIPFVGSNNVAELKAAILALSSLNMQKLQEKKEAVEILSDSQYVIKGISLWVKNWKKNNWTTATKKPVANKSLWVELDSKNNPTITWTHIRGHQGIAGNEIVDFLCKTSYRINREIDFRGQDPGTTIAGIYAHLKSLRY